MELLLLSDLFSARIYCCQLFSEPAAGSDVAGLRSKAEKDGDDWIINGSKTFISNGYLSTLAVVVARTDMDKKAAHGTSLFLVDTREHAGFNKGKVLSSLNTTILIKTLL